MWEKLAAFGWHILVALNDTGNENPTSLRAWRRLVASLLTVVILVMVGSFAWVQGWTPLSGVALASDLTTLRTEVSAKQATTDDTLTAMRILGVKAAVSRALTNRCLALHRLNQPALDAANSELDGLADQYLALMHRPLEAPSCDVVLIRDNIDHP